MKTRPTMTMIIKKLYLYLCQTASVDHNDLFMEPPQSLKMKNKHFIFPFYQTVSVDDNKH